MRSGMRQSYCYYSEVHYFPNNHIVISLILQQFGNFIEHHLKSIFSYISCCGMATTQVTNITYVVASSPAPVFLT